MRINTLCRMFFLIIICIWLFKISAECKNGCSGHGRCTVFDMCICHRNWQSNDCSERVCSQGLSFVDSPKGDLDFSGSIDSPDELVVVNSEQFPYGTTEQFPDMRDSDLNILSNSAHWYSECSNAGICNRRTGECECFDGFEGAACQYMQCPGTEYECSGHGVCKRLNSIAQNDYTSSYKLWGKDIIKGCVCDKGYYGGDCSMRYCKYGLDPLYLDDVAVVQVPMFFFAVLTDAPYYDLTNGFNNQTGYFSITVYDKHQQGYVTAPINTRATCMDIVNALEALPTNVIPQGYTKCYRSSFEDQNPLVDSGAFRVSYESIYRFYLSGHRSFNISNRPAFQDAGFLTSYARNKSNDPLLTGDIYYLQFFGNMGDFRQPSINVYMTYSNRPTLTSSSNKEVFTKVWTNGQQGSNIDYFARHCEGIRTQVKTVAPGETYLFGSNLNTKVFNKCLGNADFNTSNNIDGPVNWDYGDIYYPHIIKLVRRVDNYLDSSFIVILYYDPTIVGFDTQSGYYSATDATVTGGYRVMHPFRPLDDKEEVIFDIYLSNGILSMVKPHIEAVFDFADNRIYSTNTTYDLLGPVSAMDGELSCEANNVAYDASTEEKANCLDKGDQFFLLDSSHSQNNPAFLNLYTAVSIRSLTLLDYHVTVGDTYSKYDNVSVLRRNITAEYKRHVVTTDINTNWAQSAIGSVGVFHFYKFTPSEDSTYTYIAECANRGVCNTFEGTCDCFQGFTGDGCVEQDTIGV